MKFRAWLALALFVQLLGHPLVHGFPYAGGPIGQSVVSAPHAASHPATPIEDCALCRNSVSLERSAPAFFSLDYDVSYHVIPPVLAHVPFGFHRNVPARAPPAL